jgi:3-methyl-2-oxobutanoate hydroxymethyltransferase
MVCQGLSSTVGVTLDTMRYHVESVARGGQRVQGTTWIIGDLPFGSYHASKEQALRSASVLMQAGAHMVKLEGGVWLAPTVEFLVTRGIPVCGHIGLTPQSVNTLGGYRVQGRTDSSAQQLMQDALQLEKAGAQMLVLEMVPAVLSGDITRALTTCPTIGIGAGVDTAGQILVLHDMLGVTQGKVPKFAYNFMNEASTIKDAMNAYVRAVKEQRFPVNELHAW